MKFEINVVDDVVDRVKPLLRLERPKSSDVSADDPFKRRKVLFIDVQSMEEMNEYIEKFVNDKFNCLIEDKIESDKSIYIKDIPRKLNHINDNLEYTIELLHLLLEEEGDDDE
jgi:hypothetical protein